MMGFRATAYDPNEYFFATRYKQGGRTVYAVDFSVRELVTFLPKPDADRPLEAGATQRKIDPKHARDFGFYVREDKGWVSPAILLRAPDVFSFKPIPDIDAGTTQFGELAVPKDSASEIQIIDGQHRTLGFHVAWETLIDDIRRARENRAKALDSGTPELVRRFETDLEALETRRDTLSSERVSLQIVIIENPDIARRIFVDINDNAKGITGAVKSRFDDRKVISRAVNIVLEQNLLLDGRVDLEQDRISGASPYLVGAKHVADILRALAVGNGRVSKRAEEEIIDKELANEFDLFTDTLLSVFVELQDLVDGEVTAAELRRTSLIGSNVVLRAFGSAWYEMRRMGLPIEQIRDSFEVFAGGMELPVYPDAEDSWFRTGLFAVNPTTGSMAPGSRLQDLKTLSKFIVTASNELDSLVRAAAPSSQYLQ